MDSNHKDFSKESKKLILQVSNMIQDFIDEYSKTKTNVNSLDNMMINDKLSKNLDKINLDIDKLAISFENNNYRFDNPELNNFAIAVYYSLIQTFPLTAQFDQQMLVNILAMIKLSVFVAFEAGKLGLEKNNIEEKSKDMLKEEGFEKELMSGFSLEEWRKNIEKE